LVLVPDGSNDCGHFRIVAEMLAEDFTVLTFDMRGGSRAMPKEHVPVTPAMLAADVAGIIRAFDMAPASVYGCSAGGQAVLALGKSEPELARNLIVHEAALMLDGPFPSSGFDFFNAISGTYGPLCTGFVPRDIVFIGDKAKWDAFGEDFLKRIAANKVYFEKYYVGSVDKARYTKEELENMPNLEFSVGAWTPTWMSYANIATAERGGRPYTWLNAGHYPHVINPEEFVAFVKRTCLKYI
jgi:pimeloyl-ACP methyl ester carboxylesterase